MNQKNFSNEGEKYPAPLITGMLIWGPVVSQSLHLPRQTKPFQPSQSKVLCADQGRSQTFSFGGATRGARFATRGAVNGLCRTFRKRPGKFLGGHCGGSGPPGTPLAPPLAPTKNVRAPVVFGSYCPSSQNLIKKFA